MNIFRELEAELQNCQKCEGILSCKFVDERLDQERVKPRPILVKIERKPVMLIGQAPGLTEYRTGKPFQGPAGQEIRSVFSVCGVPALRFQNLVHTSAVVKCFPGSKKVPGRKAQGFRREDERPSVIMMNNCRPFLEQQIAHVDPKIIVLLGGVPLQAFLRLSGAASTKAELAAFVGRVILWNGRKVIPLPHTSGASFWLNKPANQELYAKAKDLLSKEIASLSL
jgi:uracil-DNA glycosylase